MQKQCEQCGTTYEAKRATSRFCGDRCRKRAQRAPEPAPVVLTVVETPPATEPPPAEAPSEAARFRFVMPSCLEATHTQLAEAGRLDTALGVAALIAARMVDESAELADTGSSRAAILKAHREALAEAVKDAETAADPLDQIRAAAALKLVTGGRL